MSMDDWVSGMSWTCRVRKKYKDQKFTCERIRKSGISSNGDHRENSSVVQTCEDVKRRGEGHMQ